MHHSFILKQLILLTFLFSAFQGGEIIAAYEYVKQNIILRCAADNITHIVIGIISWLIVSSYDKLNLSYVFQSLICGFFAGVIDVDHFFMAKSIYLKDAVNLSSRPPFHNTTLMVSFIACFILLVRAFGQNSGERIGWLLLVAVVSHHLRDALRHGLWLWPVVTKPLRFYDCLLISYLFPIAIGSLLKILDHPSPKEKNILEV